MKNNSPRLSKETDKITTSALDHIALHVHDLERSVKWYEKYVGLKPQNEKRQPNSPEFLFPENQKSGVALMPSKEIYIDHFAFGVNKNNFEKAILLLEKENIPFKRMDHGTAESIYFKDPDGFTVELCFRK
ncbi:VOC family protein [Xanthovirga aplysinae]|uniref:VOC family protein n=1 Tax=Xanthovirga aplysinae TaxID=2529853 RepID=UPI0012BC8C64|nr:VOC family protein [Xanthovirga aplysinae]MTI29714.1 VOC family protein [Xanthovirga aplysinae]